VSGRLPDARAQTQSVTTTPSCSVTLLVTSVACIGLKSGSVVSRINFRCIYFRLKIVVRPKHVLAKLNKIVKNY
jgi:hypothetical protein